MELDQVLTVYPTKTDCIGLLERLRWGSIPRCPYCNLARSSRLPREDRHHCNVCSTSFSVTVNTVFHHTHIPLQKWFAAVTLIINSRESVPARKVAKSIAVNKNSAWYIVDRVRVALLDPSQRELLQRIAEVME